MRVTAAPAWNDGRHIGEQCGTAPGLGAGVVDPPCQLPVQVPPTRGTESPASRGWTQKVVRLTTKGPSPRSKRSSVMLGTSETMRGSGLARACSRPAKSVRSEAVARAVLRRPVLRSPRSKCASSASLLLLRPLIPLRWRPKLRHAAATTWTLRRSRALGERGTWPIPRRRDAPPRSGSEAPGWKCLPIQRKRGEPRTRLPEWGSTLAGSPFACVRWSARARAARQRGCPGAHGGMRIRAAPPRRRPRCGPWLSERIEPRCSGIEVPSRGRRGHPLR